MNPLSAQARCWPLNLRSGAFGLAAGLALLVTALGDTPVRAQDVSALSELATPIIAADTLMTLVPSIPGANAIYAIGSHGLYRSPDSGQSWERSGPVPPSDYLAAGMHAPDLLLAGNHLPCQAAGGDQSPLARSEDGGATWQSVADVAGIRPIAIWGEGQTILGENCGGLLRSEDGGSTWEALPLPDNSYQVTTVTPVASSQNSSIRVVLVAGTSEGGTSRVWQADLAQPADQVYRELGVNPFWGLASLAGHENVIIIGTARGVLVSTDGGIDFPSEPSRDGLEDATLSVDPALETIPDAERERGYGINAVAIDPDRPGHFYAGTGAALFESTNNGMTWRQVPGVVGDVTELVLTAGGESLLAEADGRVVVVRLS